MTGTAIEFALHHPGTALEWLILMLIWVFVVVVLGWYLDNAYQDMRDRWRGWHYYPTKGWINAFGLFVLIVVLILLWTRVTVFLLTMG